MPRGDELPLYDIVCDRRTLISSAVKMCKRLKPPLLVANRHERLAVDDGCARLDAVIFAQVDLIHINLLICRWQVFSVL